MKSPLFAAMALLALPLSALAQDSPEELQGMFTKALLANDADALASLFAEDAVYFPVGGRLKSVGPDGVREDWGGFFSMNKVTDIELWDDGEEVLGDTAIAWGLWRMTFELVGGGESVSMEGRFLDVSKKIDGHWRYVIDHPSVPLAPPPAEGDEAPGVSEGG